MGDEQGPRSRFTGRARKASNLPGIATLLLVAACGFPRPADVGDDATAGCKRDQDCGGTTPFCVDTSCVVCKASTSCPAERPVCDTSSHDCRTCAKDSECDSGACDLAAGTCVSQGAIRYASPTGTDADPCIKTAPCSLHQGANLVDVAHSYIVLLPGSYPGRFGFDHQTATIVGNNATIAFTTPDSEVDVTNGSAVTIRDIQVEEPPGVPTDGVGWIVLINSTIFVDRMQSDTKTMSPIVGRSGDTITVRRSSFTGLAPFGTRLIADTCSFQNGSLGATGSIDVTNSVFISSGIGINPPSTASFNSKVINNTFFGGGVFCTVTGAVATFTNNIFYNYTSIDVSNNCQYDYNLVTPNKTLGGNGNTTGDPMFVDSAHGDLHLKPGSAAIDAGDPSLVSIDRDFDGTHRPQGTRSDIGAFEYKP